MDIFKNVKKLLNIQVSILIISLAINILRYLDNLPELFYLISIMIVALECIYVIIKSTDKNPYRQFSKKEEKDVDWIVNLTAVALMVLTFSLIFPLLK